MSDREKRVEFWNYLLAEKRPRPYRVTDRRLEKIKESVLTDDAFWSDVIDRHGAEYMSAQEFYGEERRFRSDHSRSNFWGMVSIRIHAMLQNSKPAPKE